VGPPVFTTQPLSVTISGGTVALHAVAAGTTTYQWYSGSLPLNGATDSVLVITFLPFGTSSYRCVATNSAGTTSSNIATVTNISSPANPGRLINLSARAQVGTGGNIIFGGFAVGGAGVAGSQSLLVRASGPAIGGAPFNVPNVISDPELKIFNQSGSVIPGDINSGWAGSPAIASIAQSVGAFSWNVASSHDAALDLALPSGPYTAQVSGESGDTGDALLEIYDATPAGSYTSASPRLINLSARVNVGQGAANALFAGFVIEGSTALTVLIRASGPAIAAAPFNVPVTLPDPALTLQYQSSGAVIASNTGWNGATDISYAASKIGAFSWGQSATADSALLITLPPGNYNAVVAGASGDSGVTLVEVYEIPTTLNL
jgi:hypothetical protein